MIKSLINRVLLPSLALILLSAPGSAQSSTAAKGGEAAARRQELIRATEEYQSSLKTLAETYEVNVKSAEEQNAKLKGLYADGIISRREMEASDSSLLEARAKLGEVRTQIEQAATSLAVAMKTPTVEEAPEVSFDLGTVTRAWTTGNKSIDSLINYYGGKYGVDPYLIYCVMHQESRFGTSATSSKGAMGLMQLMPGTAARYGVTNPYDPAQSIMGGARYLKDLLMMFGGRIDLVLAGYNAGEGAVQKYGNRIPPYAETQAYVRIIGSRYGQAFHALKPVVKTSD